MLRRNMLLIMFRTWRVSSLDQFFLFIFKKIRARRSPMHSSGFVRWGGCWQRIGLTAMQGIEDVKAMCEKQMPDVLV